MDALRKALHTAMKSRSLHRISKDSGVEYYCLHRFNRLGGLNGTNTLLLMKHLNLTLEDVI